MFLNVIYVYNDNRSRKILTECRHVANKCRVKGKGFLQGTGRSMAQTES